MDCLLNYIGLKTGTPVPYEDIPDSGLYINSLPGFSLEMIDMIANNEQWSYSGMWDDIQTEAAVRFKIDFMYELQKCFTLSKSCDYEAMICENKSILVNAWRYLLGNQTMLFRLHTSRLNRHTTIDLKDAEELRDHYQFEYEKALTLAANLIDVTSCELCCGGNPSVVTWLP